ncbi:variant-surface-glyco phospholipase c [Fusarium beomiforme]|uniref:Variant-surface-glyco phospholipase c n=1 Tax=Fusarium beomiforme TaxID=44412 RepID=A0A9P5A683_9HYPO|nr:variant-surface-glyco phospholipase c [Fusarium beomiforme]
MGEGGTLALVNGTPYKWIRTNQSNYQMNSWNLSERIDPGTVSSNYVEFNQGLFVERSDTRGITAYTLEGTDCSFRIHVSDAPSRIWVELVSLEAVNNPRGSSIQLGWRHDGIVSFILSGKQGSFHTTNPPVGWMHQNLATLGPRPLSQICMLGSHDSGMSFVSHSDIPSGLIDDYVLCQATPVHGQLAYGARYFDIRPQISGGGFWTGHYTGKIGARGESLASIISGVNSFLSQYPELVILNFSHTLQTDVGGDWRKFNDDEWRRLLGELLKLENRYVVQDEKAQDLSLIPLEDFIGKGRGAVVCVVENEGLDMREFRNEGFYKPSQLNVYNQYSNTDDAVVMVNDQIKKMKGHMPTKSKQLFLLSWTLTQQAPSWNGNLVDFATKVVAFLKPIRVLAYTCNKELVTRLLPVVNNTSFPNVIYIDYVDNSDYTALVVAVNDKVYNN